MLGCRCSRPLEFLRGSRERCSLLAEQAREAPEPRPEMDPFPPFSLTSLFSLLPPSGWLLMTSRLCPVRRHPRSWAGAEFVCSYPGFGPKPAWLCVAAQPETRTPGRPCGGAKPGQSRERLAQAAAPPACATVRKKSLVKASVFTDVCKSPPAKCMDAPKCSEQNNI